MHEQGGRGNAPAPTLPPTKNARTAAKAEGFLLGCGLNAQSDGSWSGQARWHVFDTDFGSVEKFLATWLAWRNAASRPERLFYSAVVRTAPAAEQLLISCHQCAELLPLAEELRSHWFGLLNGTHRISLAGDRVLLTVHIGALDAVAPTLDAPLNSVFLDGENSDIQLPTLKAMGRLCQPGSRLVTPLDSPSLHEMLLTTGFQTLSPTDSKKSALTCASYQPRWQAASSARRSGCPPNRRAVVIGGGLAGSASAYSLATRGWNVDVLDRAAAPASGASALPVGIVAPHVSPDDAILSRMSRAGVRQTLHRAQALLTRGSDWDLTGVLEHRVDARRGQPESENWLRWGGDWSRTATPEQQAACGLHDCDALWHAHAGWMRPAQLVQAQISHPNVRWNGLRPVSGLRQVNGIWEVLDAAQQVVATAEVVVLAAAWDTKQLLQTLENHHLPLNPLRGQVSWGPLSRLTEAQRALLPPYPVNGHGALVHGIPGPDGSLSWVIGSTFERAMPEAVIRPEDRLVNFQKLSALLPKAATALEPHLQSAHDWAAVRCTVPDRLPAVGWLDPVQAPGLAVCTGMGARGLTLSVLCGEWLAAQIHGEPWPMERKLADALNAARFGRTHLT